MENFTRIPNDLMDWVVADVSDSENRILGYVLRRTTGFNKESDAISLKQMCHGIRKYDGTKLDLGTGLSREGALRAIERLEARGLLAVSRGRGRSNPNIYSVKVHPAVAERIELCKAGKLAHAVDPFKKPGGKGQPVPWKRAKRVDHETVYAADAQKTGGNKGVPTKESRPQTFPLRTTQPPEHERPTPEGYPCHSATEGDYLTPDSGEMDALLDELTRVVGSRFAPRKERTLRSKLSGSSAVEVRMAIAEFSTETHWLEASDKAAAFLQTFARLSRGFDSDDDDPT